MERAIKAMVDSGYEVRINTWPNGGYVCEVLHDVSCGASDDWVPVTLGTGDTVADAVDSCHADLKKSGGLNED